MHKHVIAFFVIASGLTFPAWAGEGWPRFRGPNGAGVSDTAGPTQWSESDYRWRVALPGPGHSSPVVFRDRVYVTSTNPETAEQKLIAVNAADGSTAWTISLESKPYAQHRFNSFASATPAADDLHVYTLVSSAEHFQIVAVTHAGKEAWRYDLGPFRGQHGIAVSPIVYKDMVIVPNDQDGVSFVIALAAADGKMRWKTDRKSASAAYATPCIYTGADGKDQLILASTSHGMTGLDPATGKPLWELGDLFTLRVCASPVVAGDLVIATCGQGGGGKRLVAVKPGSLDGATPPTLAYEMDQALPYVPTPLYRDGRLFLLNDGGVATCVDATTGKVRWRERIGGDYFASPVASGDVIYCVGRGGQVITLRFADSFEMIGKADLGEPSFATPAITGGSIYFRTEQKLMRLGN